MEAREARMISQKISIIRTTFRKVSMPISTTVTTGSLSLSTKMIKMDILTLSEST
jgi:hypothetical protein